MVLKRFVTAIVIVIAVGMVCWHVQAADQKTPEILTQTTQNNVTPLTTDEMKATSGRMMTAGNPMLSITSQRTSHHQMALMTQQKLMMKNQMQNIKMQNIKSQNW